VPQCSAAAAAVDVDADLDRKSGGGGRGFPGDVGGEDLAGDGERARRRCPCSSAAVDLAALATSPGDVVAAAGLSTSLPRSRDVADRGLSRARPCAAAPPPGVFAPSPDLEDLAAAAAAAADVELASRPMLLHV